MSIDRAHIRVLVRAELEKRLKTPPPTRVHAALLEIYHDDPDAPIPKACVIEPDRPCTQSGYCKKLGH